MKRSITITLDEEVYKRMVDLLIKEFGAIESGRRRSSFINGLLVAFFNTLDGKGTQDFRKT